MDAAREAWLAKYAREPAPWRGGADGAWLAKRLAEAPPGPILDVGAGGGKTHAALAQAFPARRLLALDWVPASLEGLPSAATADARRLPVRASRAAAVVFAFALGALDATGRERAAAEATRALRSGGLVLVEDFAEGDLRAGAGVLVAPGTRKRDGLASHYFSPGEVPTLFPDLAVVEEALVEKPTRFAGPRRLVRVALAFTTFKKPL